MKTLAGTNGLHSYWATSKSHRYSLLFALPLLLLYELLEAISPIRSQGGVIRNGADVILTGLFSWLLGPRGPLVFMAMVIGVSLFLIWRDTSSGPLRLATFAKMAAESLAWAAVFGFVVGAVTMKVLSMSAAGPGDTQVAKLTLSLGAGLYEELLFRVVLVALLARGFGVLFGRTLGGVIATVLGALIFSAFHYMGSLGETFQVQSFVFRAIAGLAFSALYLTRGFGITAWTHALYDIFVLL
ncbi:MAG: Abortive infection protein [Gemmatimonadetes bacterium]|nr:Abortive infection protein [Gemmatimonadota bacterium]